jgi:Fe-Mn family superoxide dismutase
MPIAFPDLPYPKDALEPVISARTLEFHYGKHHKAYVDNANKMIAGTLFENEDPETIIKKTFRDQNKVGIFNNTAQAWNHTFFWKCMKKGGGKQPTGEVAERIKTDFGGYEVFAEEFKNAGTTQFGAGWAWLILDSGRLKVIKTPNAENPIAGGKKPLLVVDVWEHAYYLDYQNRRPEFLSAFIDNLINWDFVNANLR